MGDSPICRVPGAHGKAPKAHGKAHTATRDRQSRPLPCTIYRAHGKGFAVCNYRPTAKNSCHPGTMTWPGLCRVPCWRGTRQSSNLCRVPRFLHTAKIGTFAVCHGFCTRQRCQNQFFCLIITYMVPQKIIYIIMIIPCIRISITCI